MTLPTRKCSHRSRRSPQTIPHFSSRPVSFASFWEDLVTRPIETSQNLMLPFASDMALRRRFLVVDEPLAGNIRFDLLLEVLDKLAEDTALAYARRFAPEGRVVTAAIDNIL